MQTDLQRLREQHPKLYGALRANIDEVTEGIERCSSQYPCVRQIRDSIQSPTADVRSYGQALTGLVKLNIIGIYTERANSNRYDLTDPDYARLQLLEACVEADLEE